MHIQAIADIFDMRADDRALHTFSFSFDAAGDLWIVPLIRGAGVWITPDILLQTDDLKQRIQRDSLTVINLPPAYVRQLCNDLQPGELSVRVCIVGGEAFGRDDYRNIVHKLRAERVVNAYGPTETIIATSMCVWQQGERESEWALYMPIGNPVGSRRVHILDGQLRHVPVGGASCTWAASAWRGAIWGVPISAATASWPIRSARTAHVSTAPAIWSNGTNRGSWNIWPASTIR